VWRTRMSTIKHILFSIYPNLVYRQIHTSSSVLETYSRIEPGKYSVYLQTENLHTHIYIQVSLCLIWTKPLRGVWEWKSVSMYYWPLNYIEVRVQLHAPVALFRRTELPAHFRLETEWAWRPNCQWWWRKCPCTCWQSIPPPFFALLPHPDYSTHECTWY
jgi:hypothetical protein